MRDIADDVAREGPLVHRPGRAAHVHENQSGASTLYEMGESGIGSKAAHVIDNFYSCFQTSFGNLGFLRIERNGNSQFARQTLEYRQDTRELFLCAYGVSSGASRFSSYIENVCARLFQFERSLYRQLRVGITSTGIEAVWRDIEDAHDQGALAERQRTRRQTQTVPQALEHRRPS